MTLKQIKRYILDSRYVVMWVDTHGYRVLDNKILESDYELKVGFQENRGEYIDLFNTSLDDIKVYREIKREV